MSRLILFIIFVAGYRAHAYPEFIGHGYSSCTTCHWSATGGGGLTDYGRALWATEIAAKPFGFGSDEKLGEWSGFLGPVQTPYWLKPAYKFRRLFNSTNPGSYKVTNRYYAMQSDFNVASFVNEDNTLGAVATLALVENPLFAYPNTRIGNSSMMMREYYVRYQMNQKVWWYVGLMDKAFGIKTPDHTAVNRSPIHLGENDQVHSVMMTYQTPKDELFIQPFVGNLTQPGSLQSRGLTVQYEHEPVEKMRVGASGKYESSQKDANGQIAGTFRKGVGKGHALLAELGLNKDQYYHTQPTLGAYLYSLLNVQFFRGFNFQSVFQFNRTDFSQNIPDTFSWGFGILYFPMQRVEWRMQAVHQRIHVDNAVEADEWLAQAQLHLSL